MNYKKFYKRNKRQGVQQPKKKRIPRPSKGQSRNISFPYSGLFYIDESADGNELEIGIGNFVLKFTHSEGEQKAD